MMVEISIITPIYNVDKYIDRCIQSIIKQTFNKWELILLDDGSIDLSGKICDTYAKLDKRIKVIRKKNTGVSNTRNLGINLSKGKYITFVDGDDWIEKDYLEKMFYAIKEMEVDILVTGCVYETKKGTVNPFKIGEKSVFNKTEAQLEFLKQDKFIWTICDKLYKKSLFKNIMLDEKLKMAEDMLLFWTMINSVEKIGYLPLYKYHYDLKASNTMTKPFSHIWFHPLKVKRYIFREVKNISSEHKRLSKAVYLGEIVGVMKKSMLNDKYNVKYLITTFQKIIRKNFYYAFYKPFCNVLTLKQRLGLIYFLLPYKFLKFTKKITIIKD